MPLSHTFCPGSAAWRTRKLLCCWCYLCESKAGEERVFGGDRVEWLLHRLPNAVVDVWLKYSRQAVLTFSWTRAVSHSVITGGGAQT
ncbi:hypothetical protein E2C01_009361 [Portunus trituberculatus]|uniref:Uncharacterized protein n=1 Tax=Portunus trituberculatus TaxID=210409 RepID=A0A5B7D5G8_PORTR|nr:hypothetical protein [Portunus trituberculatus]